MAASLDGAGGVGLSVGGTLSENVISGDASEKTFGGSDISSSGISISGHGFSTGDKVTFVDKSAVTGNKPVAGLNNGGTYYVNKIDGSTIKLAKTRADANAGTNLLSLSDPSDGSASYALVKGGHAIQAYIEAAEVEAATDVTVSADNSMSIFSGSLVGSFALGGAKQVGVGAAFAGAGSLNKSTARVESAIRSSNVTTTSGDVTVLAENDSSIKSDTGGWAVAIGFGKEIAGVGVSVGFGISDNNVFDVTRAAIDSSVVSAGDDISVLALTSAKIDAYAYGGAGALGVSGKGGVGAGVAGAGAGSENLIGNSTIAEIVDSANDGSDGRAILAGVSSAVGDGSGDAESGDVLVLASDTSQIEAKADGGAVSIGASKTAGFALSIAAVDSDNDIQNLVRARIADSAIGADDGSINVEATTPSDSFVDAEAIAVSIAVSGGKVGGLSFSGGGAGAENNVKNRVEAVVETTNPASSGGALSPSTDVIDILARDGIRILAADSSRITSDSGTYAIALAIGKGGFAASVGITENFNTITTATRASFEGQAQITGRTADASSSIYDDFAVQAISNAYVTATGIATSIAVALAKFGGGIAVAGTTARSTVSGSVEASIEDGSTVDFGATVADGDVFVSAISEVEVSNKSTGIAISGGTLFSVSVGSSRAFSTVDQDVSAYIAGDVTGANDVEVDAATAANVVTNAFALAGGLAAVSINVASGLAETTVGGTSQDPMTIEAYISGEIGTSSEEVTGNVDVRARSEMDAESYFWGGAFTLLGVAVAGGTSTVSVTPTISARINGPSNSDKAKIYAAGNLQVMSLFNWRDTASGFARIDDSFYASAIAPAGGLFAASGSTSNDAQADPEGAVAKVTVSPVMDASLGENSVIDVGGNVELVALSSVDIDMFAESFVIALAGEGGARGEAFANGTVDATVSSGSVTADGNFLTLAGAAHKASPDVSAIAIALGSTIGIMNAYVEPTVTAGLTDTAVVTAGGDAMIASVVENKADGDATSVGLGSTSPDENYESAIQVASLSGGTLTAGAIVPNSVVQVVTPKDLGILPFLYTQNDEDQNSALKAGKIDTRAKTLTQISADITALFLNVAPVFGSDTSLSVRSGTSGAYIDSLLSGQGTASFEVTDPDDGFNNLTFTVIGGADAAKFEFVGDVLTLTETADILNPTDAGEDGQYEVTVRVTDTKGGVAEQAVTVDIIASTSYVEGDDLSVVAGATLLLTQANVEDMRDAAIDRWIASGITAEQEATLRALTLTVKDMPGQIVGVQSGNEIVFDLTAASRGWYIDRTPYGDEEFVETGSSTLLFAENGLAKDRIDLLTIMVHEMGHALGLKHVDDRTDVMDDGIVKGVRRLPSMGQAEDAAPDGFGRLEYVELDSGAQGAGSLKLIGGEESNYDEQFDATVGMVAITEVNAISNVDQTIIIDGTSVIDFATDSGSNAVYIGVPLSQTALAGGQSLGIGPVGIGAVIATAHVTGNINVQIDGTFVNDGDLTIEVISNGLAKAGGQGLSIGFGAGTGVETTAIYDTAITVEITEDTTIDLTSAADSDFTLRTLAHGSAVSEALGIAVGYGLGIGASIAKATLAPTIQTIMRDGASIEATGDVTLETRFNVDRTGRETGGGAFATSISAAGALVGAGSGADSDAVSASVVKTFVEQNATIDADGTVRVASLAAHRAEADAFGLAVALGASVGASLADAVTEGSTQAFVDGTIVDSGAVEIVAASRDVAIATSFAAAGGILSGSGAEGNATVRSSSTDNPTSLAYLSNASGAAHNSSGNVEISATSAPQALGVANGISVGVGIGVGVQIGSAVVTPLIQAYIGSNVTLNAGSVVVRAAQALPTSGARTALGLATGASGGLIGVNATDADSQVDGDVEAEIRANATINATGDVSVSAATNAEQLSNASGVAVGIIAAGANPSNAVTDTSTTAYIKAGVSITTPGTVKISATGEEKTESKATSGSGGVVAGAAANADTDATSLTKATLGAAVLSVGSLEVTSEHTANYNGEADSVSAAVVGASGAFTDNDVDATVKSIIEDGATVVATGGAVLVEAINRSRKDNISGYNVESGSGGVIDLPATRSDSLVKKETQAKLGAGASIALSGDTATAVQFRALNDAQAHDDAKLDSGGAISVAKAESDVRIGNSSNPITADVDIDGRIDSTANVELSARTLADIYASANAKTYGGAGAAQGFSRALVDSENTVNVDSGATVRSGNLISAFAGGDASGQTNDIDAEARTDLWNKTAFPIETDPEAIGDIDVVNKVQIDGKLLSVGDVELGAFEGTIEAIGKGVGKDLYRQLGEDIVNGIGSIFGAEDVSFDITTESSSESSIDTVDVDGEVRTGIQNQQFLTIDEDVVLQSASGTPVERNFTTGNVDFGTNTIDLGTAHGYVDGDAVVYDINGSKTGLFRAFPNTNEELVDGGVYFVIASSATTIQLADTIDDAFAGTEIDLADVASTATTGHSVTAFKFGGSDPYPIQISLRSEGVPVPTVSFEDIGAGIAARIEELNAQAVSYDLDPVAKASIEDQINTLLRQGEALGIVTERLDSNGDPYKVVSENFVAAFIEVDDITARVGDIFVTADNFTGSGVIDSPGNANIKIVNNSPYYLRVNDLQVPVDTGGAVFLNDVKVDDAAAVNTANQASGLANFSTYNTAASSAAPSVVVENKFIPAFANQDLFLNTAAPGMEIAGKVLVNGLAEFLNEEGSIYVTGEIDAAEVDIDAGADFVLTSVGFAHLGGDPQLQWSSEWNAAEQTAIDDIEDETKTNRNESTRTSSSSGYKDGGRIVAGGNVFINADYLNINGEIRSGRVDRTVTIETSDTVRYRGLDLPVLTAIAAFQAAYDADVKNGREATADRFLEITQEPEPDESGLVQLDAGSNADPDVIETFYDAKNKEIVVNNVAVGGGFISLFGYVFSTGDASGTANRGWIRVADGYGHINVVNNTGITTRLNKLDTGGVSGIEGEIQITDTSKLNGGGSPLRTTFTRIDNAIFKETQYVGASGTPTPVAVGAGRVTTYDVTDDLIFRWNRGLETTTTEIYEWTRSSFWGIPTGSSDPTGPADITVDSSDSEPIPGEAEFVSVEPSVFSALQTGYEFDNITESADRRLVNQREYETSSGWWIFSEKTFHLERTYEEAAKEFFRHSVRADIDVGIGFIGFDSGDINVQSVGDIRITSDITNASGLVTLNSTAGDIEMPAQEALILAQDIDLTAANGVGQDYELKTELTGSTVSVDTGTGDIQVNVTRGDVDVEKASTGDGNVFIDAQGNINWIGTGSDVIRGGRVELTSLTGSIGSSAAVLQVDVGEVLQYDHSGEVVGLLEEDAGLIVSAAGDIFIEETDGALGVIDVRGGGIVSLEADGALVDYNTNAIRDERALSDLQILWGEMDLVAEITNAVNAQDLENKRAVEDRDGVSGQQTIGAFEFQRNVYYGKLWVDQRNLELEEAVTPTFDLSAASFDEATDTINFAGPHNLITGERLAFATNSGKQGVSGLEEGAFYYAIVTGSSSIQLAASRTDATAGTAIDLDASAARTTIERALVSASGIDFAADHGFVDGDAVVYQGAGDFGLTDGATYFVSVIDSDSIALASSAEDAVAGINLVALSVPSAGADETLLDLVDLRFNRAGFDVTTGSVDDAADSINLGYAHGLSTGDAVVFRNVAGAANIPALDDGRAYYAVVVDATTLKLAETRANAVAGTPTVVDLDASAARQSFDLTDVNAEVENIQFAPISVSETDVAADGQTIVFESAHGLSDGDRVQFAETNVLGVGNLDEVTIYTVSVIDDTSIQLKNGAGIVVQVLTDLQSSITRATDGAGQTVSVSVTPETAAVFSGDELITAPEGAQLVISVENGGSPVSDFFGDGIDDSDAANAIDDYTVGEVVNLDGLGANDGSYLIIDVSDDRSTITVSAALGATGLVDQTDVATVVTFNLLPETGGEFTRIDSTITFATGHGYVSGDAVIYEGAGGYGLQTGQTYYVDRVDALTISLAETQANALAGERLVTLSTPGGSGSELLTRASQHQIARYLSDALPFDAVAWRASIDAVDAATDLGQPFDVTAWQAADAFHFTADERAQIIADNGVAAEDQDLYIAQLELQETRNYVGIYEALVADGIEDQYDPNYVYVVDPTSDEAADLTDGATWSTSELSQGVSKSVALKTVTDTTTSIEAPNVIGKDVRLTSGIDTSLPTSAKGVGVSDGVIEIDIASIATGLPEDQALALASAERDDVTFLDVNRAVIDDPFNPGTTTEARFIRIDVREDFDVQLGTGSNVIGGDRTSGVVSVTSGGQVFLGSERDINVDTVSGSDLVRIKGDGSLFDVTVLSSDINVTGDGIVLEAGGGANDIGTSAAPIKVSLLGAANVEGGGLSARAQNVYLSAPAGDLIVDFIFAGQSMVGNGTVELTAQGGILDAFDDSVLNIEAGTISFDAGGIIGADPSFLNEFLEYSAGTIASVSAGGNVFLDSDKASDIASIVITSGDIVLDIIGDQSTRLKAK